MVCVGWVTLGDYVEEEWDGVLGWMETRAWFVDGLLMVCGLECGRDWLRYGRAFFERDIGLIIDFGKWSIQHER